jgi:indolepyruvate ferredoxin oxidoreductase
MTRAVARHTDSDRNVSVDARRLAEALFGDYMATNMLALGAAYQAGLLPLSAASIEQAVALNGVQVQQTIQAFRYGRLYVADRNALLDSVEAKPRNAAEERAHASSHLSARDRRAYESLMARCAELDGEAQRMLAIRVAELIQYQSASYAESYLTTVLDTARAERIAAGGRTDVTHAVIRYLYKLMAYKDEYEVARLHTRPDFQRRTRELFVDAERMVYNLHPPLLRAFGLKRKLRLGPWFTPALRGLSKLRGLRGTRFDPFGYAHLRREERRLVSWYLGLVRSALAELTPQNHDAVVAIAQLPDRIRGYEEIKLKSIAATEAHAAVLMRALSTRQPAVRPA